MIDEDLERDGKGKAAKTAVKEPLTELQLFKQKVKELEEANAVLAEKEKRLRLLITGVEDYAIFMLDTNGYVTSWNEGAQRIKGYTADEIIGKHFSLFLPKGDIERGKHIYELKVARQDGKYEEENWRVRKNGTYFWANVIISAIKDENGEVIGFSKITKDLTNRRISEEALRESELRYRMLISSIKDYAIFMLDTQGRIASWNDGAERIKGYTSEEAIGMHFSNFYTKEDREAHRPEKILLTAEKEGKYEEEGWRVKKDGSRFWAGVLITALRNERNELIGYSKVTRDLTERKIADERLHEKNRKLEASNVELEQFAYVASHDLQEPLRTVASYVQLLEKHFEDNLDETATEYMHFIMEGATRMRNLINALLEYSRVGRLEHDRAVVNLNEVVKVISDNMKASTPEIEIIVADTLPVINAVPVNMYQLFQNLISNAAKFRKPDVPPVITISVNRLNDNFWQFSVKDNGIGMDPQFSSKIFHIFQRLHTRDAYPGSGIGLSICKKIVELHGGEIHVNSTEGVGTEFIFTLPA